MRAAFSIFFLFFYLSIHAQQGVRFEWARSAGSGQFEYPASVAVDAAGNVYHAGDFRGLMDCDPGPGVHEISPHGGVDAYVIKYDAQGNFLWGKSYGTYTSEQESLRGMTVDAAGNIYLTGHFSDICDFDPGPGVFHLVSNAAFHDAYLLKLDTDGNFVWAKNIAEGWDANISHAITVDASGNIYAGGWFRGTTDFDPGPGTFNLVTTGTEQNAYVAKFDNAGNFIWAKGYMGQRTSIVTTIRIDASDNVYTAGLFYGTTDFDPGTGTYDVTNANPSISSSFITKLDAGGNFLWAKNIRSAVASNRCFGMALDPSGNIYTTGSFHGNTDFDPGPGLFMMSGPGQGKAYILKLTGNGDFIWAKKFTSAGTSPFDDIQSYGIDCDLDGDVYTTGTMYGDCNFDPGASDYTIGPEVTSNIAFIAKLKADGSFAFALEVEAMLPTESRSIRTDAAKNIYINGYFQATADLNPTAGVYNNTSVGYTDAFMIKLSQCNQVTTETLNVAACNSYTLNGETYTSTGTYTQYLDNHLGCDSIITLNLRLGGSTTTQTAVVCDSVTWEGQTLTNSGTYTATYIGADGCDSIRILNLTIMRSTYETVDTSICEGESYMGYTTSGTYVDTLISNARCNVIQTLNLIVKSRAYSNHSATICEGDAYWGYNTSGTYRDTLIAANGCDSVRTLVLVVNPKKQTNITASICQGESYFAAGALQTTSGVYTDVLSSASGCDSIVITTLSVYNIPVPKLGADRELCEGSTLELNPGTFTSYEWQDMSTTPTFNVSGPGTYRVKVTTNNCSANDTINISSKPCFRGVYIPSAFSPNNDNLNDVFRASVNADLVQFRLEVYNRWGELVFRTADPSNGWDGKLKGKQLDTGVFIWVCKYQLRGQHEVLQKGKLVLIR